MEEKLRKYRDTVYIVGTGTLFLSIWGIFKALALSILSKASLETLIGYLPENVSLRKIYPFVWSLLILDIILRIIICRCARAEARGKKQGGLYIFLSLFLIFSYFLTILDRFGEMFPLSSDFPDYVVMNLIDGTSMIVLIELVYSVIRVRHLTRMLEKGRLTADRDYAA